MPFTSGWTNIVRAQVCHDVSWIVFTAQRKLILEFGDRFNAWLKENEIPILAHASGAIGDIKRSRDNFTEEFSESRSDPARPHGNEPRTYAVVIPCVHAHRVVEWLAANNVKVSTNP